MTESFKCPSCCALLEFEEKPMQKCKFCGSNVIVLSGVIQNSSVFSRIGTADFSDLSALTGKALKIGEIQRLLQGGNKIQMFFTLFRILKFCALHDLVKRQKSFAANLR